MGINFSHNTDETSSGLRPAAAGVLLLGIQLLIFGFFLNPWFLGWLVPELNGKYAAAKDWLWPIHVVGVLSAFWVVRRWRELGSFRPARIAFERVPFVGGILLSIGTMLVLVAAQEVTFKGLSWIKAKGMPLSQHVEGDNDGGKLFCFDPLLGNRGVPLGAQHHRARLQPDDIELFDATYHLNEYGFRVVPQDEGEKKQHLAAFGCSFTFGEGVEDDETLLAQLACVQPETEVYGFAMPGYGPGQPVLQIQSGMMDHIREVSGAAVYLYMNDHVKRVTPNLRKVQWYTENYPAFILGPSGEPEYVGSLSDVFARRLSAYEFLSCLNFSKWAGLDFPVFGEANSIALSVALLDAARKAYEERFPGNRFYVIVDPVCHYQFDVATLCRVLREREFDYFDPKGLYGANPWGKYHYPVDGHPTPEAHALLAAWFWEQFPDGLLAGPRKGAE